MLAVVFVNNLYLLYLNLKWPEDFFNKVSTHPRKEGISILHALLFSILGNFPDTFKLEACVMSTEEEKECIARKWMPKHSPKWITLLPPMKVNLQSRNQLKIN